MDRARRFLAPQVHGVGLQTGVMLCAASTLSGCAISSASKPMPMEIPLQVTPGWLEPSTMMSEARRSCSTMVSTAEPVHSVGEK